MKKHLLLLFFALLSYSVNSQELITEFSTTHVMVNNGIAKSNIHFQLFEDKLLLSYQDKKAIKKLKKKGEEAIIVFPYSLKKKSNEQGYWYKYDDENIVIMVLLKGTPQPTVAIESKSNVGGQFEKQHLYFSD